VKGHAHDGAAAAGAASKYTAGILHVGSFHGCHAMDCARLISGDLALPGGAFRRALWRSVGTAVAGGLHRFD